MTTSPHLMSAPNPVPPPAGPPVGGPYGAPQPPAIGPRAPRRSRISEAAEALGYGGGALTCLGALFLLSTVWSDLGGGVQAGLLAIATLALAGVAALVGDEDRIARHLSGTLWLMSAGTGTFTTYLVADSVADLGADAGLLAAGLTAATSLGVAWWRTGRAAFGAMGFLGLLVAIVGGVGVAGGGDDLRILALWTAAASWVAAATAGILAPPAAQRTTGAVRLHHSVGALTAISAAQAMIVEASDAGLAIALVTVAVLIASALRLTDGLPIGWSVLAGLLFVPQAADAWVPDDLAGPVAMLSGGVGMLAICAWLVVRARRQAPAPAPRPASGVSSGRGAA